MIEIPQFKSKTNRLYGDLLNRQLEFSDAFAQMFKDPGGMAASYRDSLASADRDDPTGSLLMELTGDPNAGASYDLARKNKRAEMGNDFLAQLLGPEGMLSRLKGGAAAFGPEVLSILPLLQQTAMPQPKEGGGLFGDLLGVAGAASGLGWSPFG